jgi:hypothetical protein
MHPECVVTPRIDGIESQLATVVRMLAESKAARMETTKLVETLHTDLGNHMVDEVGEMRDIKAELMALHDAHISACNIQHVSDKPWLRRTLPIMVGAQFLALSSLIVWALVEREAFISSNASIAAISKDMGHIKAFWGVNK